MAQRPDPQIALGAVIRARREELEKTQEQIALASETDQARVSRVERGENPSYGLAKRIALALGWSLPELAQRAEDLENELQDAGGGGCLRRRIGAWAKTRDGRARRWLLRLFASAEPAGRARARSRPRRRTASTPHRCLHWLPYLPTGQSPRQAYIRLSEFAPVSADRRQAAYR